MPLKKGSSKKTISANIKTEMKRGKTAETSHRNSLVKSGKIA